MPSHCYSITDFIDCTVGCVNGLGIGERGKRYPLLQEYCHSGVSMAKRISDASLQLALKNVNSNYSKFSVFPTSHFQNLK